MAGDAVSRSVGKGCAVRAAVRRGMEARPADMNRLGVHPARMPASAHFADGRMAAAVAPSVAGAYGSGNKERRGRKGRCHRDGSDKPPEHACLPRLRQHWWNYGPKRPCGQRGKWPLRSGKWSRRGAPADVDRRSYSSSSAAGGSSCSERMLQANSTGRTAEAK
jgi:hypothetical protein